MPLCHDHVRSGRTECSDEHVGRFDMFEKAELS